MLQVFNRSEKARRSPSRSIAIVGALLTSFGILSISSHTAVAAASIQDFEGYADTAAAEDDDWFASSGDGGGTGIGIEEIDGNSVLSIGWNTTSGGWGAIGQNQDPQLDWSSYDGVRFWMKGSDNGGSFNFEVQTDNGDGSTAMAHGSAITDDTDGWTLVSVPFSSLTNGYDWNAGGADLDLTKVKAFLFSGFVGSDNGGAKIDQFELYNTGDPETALGPCPGTMISDFENYADTAAAEDDDWFASSGDGGGTGIGIEEIDGNSVLSIGWNTTSGGWGAIGQNQDPQLDWSNCDGMRFWMKGSGNGGSFNFEVQTDNGDGSTAMAHGSAITDDTDGWTLVSVPFSSLTNGYDWNAGGADLDLTKVKAFLFSGFVGSDNGGAKIDQFQLYKTGDEETPLNTPRTTEAPTTTAAPTTTVELSCAAPSTSVETFESYDASTSPPSPWFNYDNAGGGISVIEQDGERARTGQSGQNKIFAWGFDAISAPGYGGVGKNFDTPLDWSGNTGVQFWMWGSGEGGELQVEIGEDKTSDVERYRSAALIDNWTGWKLVKLPFSSFSPGSYNPNPGNGKLDLTTVNNLVFAANSGKTDGGVALDNISVYCVEGMLPSTGSSPTNSTSGVAVLTIIAGIALMLLSQTRRRQTT